MADKYDIYHEELFQFFDRYTVTKYDTKYRREDGSYSRDEWTEMSDVGKIYNGELFTIEEYYRVEALYVNAVLVIMNYFNSKSITVLLFGTDDKRKKSYINNIKNNPLIKGKLFEGSIIDDIETISELIRLCLRRIIGMHFEITNNQNVRMGFDYDYYMYLYVQKDEPILFEQINSTGLFVY